MPKDVYKLNEVSQGHPLLQTERLDEVLTYWPQQRNNYILGQRMPVVEEDTDKIVADLTKHNRGGMTPMVSMRGESPIHDPKHGRGRIEFEAATFREKTVLQGDDLYDLRRVGTRGEYVRARNVLRQRMADLEIRLMNRLEFSRHQALFDGQFSGEVADTGKQVTVAYPHPDYLEPTASTLFSNYSSAEPILALEDWIENYEFDTGRVLSDIIFPHNLMKHLVKNSRFRELAKQNLGTFRGSRGEIQTLMTEIVGIGSMTISKDFIQFQTDVTSSVGSGAGSIDLDKVDQLSSGMNIYIVDEEASTREKLEVDTISGNTVSLVGTTSNSYSVGASVKYQVPTIPEDRIVGFGQWNGPMSQEGKLESNEPQAENIDDWGNVVSTRSHYADLEDPEPGMFTRSIDKTESGDPPRIEQILGIRALPRITDNQAWTTLKVL